MPIQFRRDLSANWRSANPTLATGEPAWETDTKLLKVGDGTTAYNFLAHVNLGSQIAIPGGRLTPFPDVPAPGLWWESAPVSLVYYVPHTSDVIVLHDGSTWRPFKFTGTTALNLAGLPADKCFDVFAYQSNGVVVLTTTQWQNNFIRAVNLTLSNGIMVKSGNQLHRYIGTIRTSGPGVTISTQRQRFIYNYYNQLPSLLFGAEYTGHTYSTSAPRMWNNSVAGPLLEYVTGAPGIIHYGQNIYMRYGIASPRFAASKPIALTLAAPAALGATSLTLSESAGDNVYPYLYVLAPFAGSSPYITSISGNVAQLSSGIDIAAPAGASLVLAGYAPPQAFTANHIAPNINNNSSLLTFSSGFPTDANWMGNLSGYRVFYMTQYGFSSETWYSLYNMTISLLM
jgi:hypothetical protein